MRCPFYDLVPKDPFENLEWRQFLLDRAESDPRFAELLVDACSQDILFFINSFCFTLDPRRSDCPKIPWITWPEQDQCILAIQASLGVYDLWVPKSRDQSLTWNTLVGFGHDFLFHEDVHYMLASWKEEMVDSGSPNCLFAKLDCMFGMLPEFLKPELRRVNKLWMNVTLGGTIGGEATTGDLGRAGRQKGIMVDEAATIPELDGVIQSTAAVSNNRIFISTHKGPHTAFHKELTKPGRTVLKVHWTSRPEHRRGLYTSRNGRVVILDRSFRGKVRIESEVYNFPDEYPFVLDGKLRSPHYDQMCQRLGNDPVKIASEMDINPIGSVANYFELAMVDRIRTTFCRPPMHTGEVDFDDRSGDPSERGFCEVPSGRLRLWVHVDQTGLLPRGSYGLACDIGAGTGSSLSSVGIANLDTGDYVGSWDDAHTSPEMFAYQVTALRKWLGAGGDSALVIWEQNGGPGATFAKKLLELDSSNVYLRESRSGRGDRTSMPGWWSDGVTKPAVFGELRDALNKDRFIVPDEHAVEELRQYQYGPGGIPVHGGSVTDDVTAARDAHGDRVVKLALLWQIVKARIETEPGMDNRYPVNSVASHIKEAVERERRESLGLLPCEWEMAGAA